VFWLIFFGAAVIAGLAIYLSQRQPVDRDLARTDPASGRGLRYVQCRPLSEPEQVLYWRLVEALPECVVLPQVSFSRFMKPAPDVKLFSREYRALYARISQKSVDFLVCLRDFTMVAAIELDDSTSDVPRDARGDVILKAAGVVPLRVDVQDMPSVEALRAMFTKAG
jgi:hypothetical protein